MLVLVILLLVFLTLIVLLIEMRRRKLLWGCWIGGVGCRVCRRRSVISISIVLHEGLAQRLESKSVHLLLLLLLVLYMMVLLLVVKLVNWLLWLAVLTGVLNRICSCCWLVVYMQVLMLGCHCLLARYNCCSCCLILLLLWNTCHTLHGNKLIITYILVVILADQAATLMMKILRMISFKKFLREGNDHLIATTHIHLLGILIRSNRCLGLRCLLQSLLGLLLLKKFGLGLVWDHGWPLIDGLLKLVHGLYTTCAMSQIEMKMDWRLLLGLYATTDGAGSLMMISTIFVWRRYCDGICETWPARWSLWRQ